MTAYDSVQRLGSHQNVITTRLNEGIGLSHKHIKILSTDLFPNGYQYHHERSYMKRLREKQVDPYNFHMVITITFLLIITFLTLIIISVGHKERKTSCCI